MKIAVISDTHDHVRNLERAIAQMNEETIGLLFHCGDLVSPFVIKTLSEFKGKVHIVFGNNEGDRFSILKAASSFPNITLHGEVGFVECGTLKIAFTHRPEFAAGLACSGNWNAVFYGHTHRRKTERIGSVWLVNPGELMGLLEPPGWIIFDPENETLQHRSLE